MNDSMLLVLPVPFRLIDGKLHVEGQAANGLDRWADNFAHVTVAAPVIPESQVGNLAGFTWRPVDELEHTARILCRQLPWAYTPAAFYRALKPTRALLAEDIRQAQHLQFAIGGLVGDWAAIAALEAASQQRRYAIHTDRVEHEVMRKTASSATGLRRVKIAVEAPLMERYHRRLIRGCSLGLWHGDDCFRAYSPWCRENHLVHDVHTKPADLISDPDLAAKLTDIRQSQKLRLIYAGRLDPMKAPLEWLKSLAMARDLIGPNFEATWYGEGALLDASMAERSRLGLDQLVTFGGFVASRPELLANVRHAHATVFTHITPESPRNLLESLVSGTPILGYSSPYAADLLAGHGGGSLVPVHDHEALGRLIKTLANDRAKLAQMTQSAAESGRRFSDTGVFAERSALIKQFA